VFKFIVPGNKLDYCNLAAYANPSVINIFVNKKHSYWVELSGHPNAIHLLENNLDKANWCHLSINSKACHILEKNLDKVDWCSLSANPKVFSLNIHAIRDRCYNFAEELAAYVFRPDRLMRISTQYSIDFDKYLFLV
jgi:hypothetical protein